MEKPPWVYDIVSIKLEDPNAGAVGFRKTPVGFEAYTVSLKDLIKEAYGLDDPSLVTDAPEWKTHYHVVAKLENERAAILNGLSPQEQTETRRVLLQSLLAEYFHLKVHHAKQSLAIYSLIAEKDGAKLKHAVFDRGGALAENENSFVGDGRLTGVFSTSRLAHILSISRLAQIDTSDRPVIDNTGMEGEYVVDLAWTPLSGPQSIKNAPSTEVYSSLQSALEDRLGLRLVPEKIQADAIMVDHVEKPVLD